MKDHQDVAGVRLGRGWLGIGCDSSKHPSKEVSANQGAVLGTTCFWAAGSLRQACLVYRR